MQLQYTDIDAPIDARTGSLLINLGNLVKANDTPYLVQLNQITPIYVTFSVPEASLATCGGTSVPETLRFSPIPRGSQPVLPVGRLTFIDNGVDTTTGAFKLKGTFQNKDRRLWPGQFVDVTLELAIQKKVVVVPTKAIQTGQQGEYLYVVRTDSTAEARPVRTGAPIRPDIDFRWVEAGRACDCGRPAPRVPQRKSYGARRSSKGPDGRSSHQQVAGGID